MSKNNSGTFLLFAFLAGCGGTVAHSEPISIKVGKISEGDVKQATYDFDKEVSTESGNPYKVFVDAARAELDGADPSLIVVEDVLLTVASDSDGIGTNGFAEIMKSVEIYLTKSDTTVVIGTTSEIPNATTMEVPVTVDESRMRVIHEHLVKGDFKVGVRGDTIDTLPAKFELRVNAQLTFRAEE